DNVHRIDLEFITQLDKSRVEPRELEAFVDFHDAVQKHYRALLTFKPTQDLADAPALETVLTLGPDDSASAVVLAQLYHQNGKAAEAERVLRRARYYKPQDAALWELTAKLAGAAAQEASYHELVKRFPNEPRYAVALG